MIKRRAMFGLIAAQLAMAPTAQAEEHESTAIIEIGGASEWSSGNSGFSFGPSIALEVTPVQNWLEVEAGVTPLFGNNHTEWNTDVVLRKPFDLSDTVELEVGLGPEWIHATGGAEAGSSFGVEAVLELQFWPWSGRKLGWFFEPSYGYDFGRGHEQSLGVSVGLLIPIDGH
jgi:hypothetical protein